VVDENTPVMTPNGAAIGVLPSSGSDARVQERRVRSQRHRNYMSRTHLHTPPDLPEGYGEAHNINKTDIPGIQTYTLTHTHSHITNVYTLIFHTA
jgi:hypothetical protein